MYDLHVRSDVRCVLQRECQWCVWRAAAELLRRSPPLPPMFFRTVRRTSVELLLSPAQRVTSWNESAAYLVREPTFELTVEGRIRVQVSGRQCAASACRRGRGRGREQQSAFRHSLLELRAELADSSAASPVPPAAVGTRAEAVAVGASSARARRAGAGAGADAAPVPLERVEVALRTDDTHAFETRRVLDVGASEYLRCSLLIPLHRPAPGAPIRVQLRAAVLTRPLLCRCRSKLLALRRCPLRARTPSSRAQWTR